MDQESWNAIVLDFDSPEVEKCVNAASRLHVEAVIDDVPKLLALLGNESFFVREAAAWPLAELAGPLCLLEMFAAYQRGFDDGHDNDGFTAALLEIPFLFPEDTKKVLLHLMEFGDEKTRGHAQWLTEFCA